MSPYFSQCMFVPPAAMHVYVSFSSFSQQCGRIYTVADGRRGGWRRDSGAVEELWKDRL